jgi:hypothetical protein
VLGVDPVVGVLVGTVGEVEIGVDVGVEIGGVDGLDELLGCGPRTQTITAVNTMTAAAAAAAMTTSRRSRGGR